MFRKKNIRADHSPDKWVLLMGFVLTCAICLLMAVIIRGDYQVEIRRARNETANLSVVLAKHISETFFQIENTLFSLRQTWQRGVSVSEMRLVLENIVHSKSDMFNLISVIGPDGYVIVTDQEDSKPVNSGDRPFFLYHRTNSDRAIHLGTPILGRVTGKWYIPVSVRLEDAGGNFCGVLLASVNPYYFSKIFTGVNLGRDSLVYLADYEGTTYSGMIDGRQLSLDKKISFDETKRNLKSYTHSEEAHTSHFDLISRIVSSTPVRGRNMYVAVGVSRKHSLRLWSLRARALGVILTAFSLFVILFVLRLHRAMCERKQSEQRSLLSEDKLRVTLNSIGDGVIATDINGNVTLMNPIAERLTGWGVSEALGRPLDTILKIIAAQNRERVEIPVTRILERGGSAASDEQGVLVARDGREYRISDSAAPIMNDRGETIGVVLVFRDITDEYILQEQLLQSQKLEAVGQLAGGIAHDFNNMLGGIIGAAEILETSLADDQTASEYLAMIRGASVRAADLAAKLLAFSRRQESNFAPIDVHRSIGDALSILENTLDKRVTIVRSLAASESTVMGDATQLQSLFLNLGINAFHAMEGGGMLTFASRVRTLSSDDSAAAFVLQPGDYIEVEVSDTGCGISRSDLPHIFEPFFTTKERGKGTGLGLAVVYGTVTRHDGSITAFSEVGKGTTFKILLPLTKKSKIMDSEISAPVSGNGTILVVDDEEMLRSVSRALLRKCGYEVLTACDGREALDIYRSSQSDITLILLDMIMPVMSGRETFFELKKINPAVKIVLCSGFSDSDDLDALKEFGLEGFLQKPYNGAELSRVVADAINHMRQ